MKNYFLFFAALYGGSVLTAQTNTQLSLTHVRLYSSGVAQYEHRQKIRGAADLEFLFSPDQINDVLKSIEIYDPAAKKISIAYQSSDTLRKTLESLKIDLSSNPSLFEILKAQRGSDLIVYAPEKIEGKILSIQEGIGDSEKEQNAILSLAAKTGVRLIPFNKIDSFLFADERRNEDLNRALDLMAESASQTRKKLTVQIQAKDEREVGIWYVMPAPIWKASYRINMMDGTAALHGWAIIDNSSDIDWKNIELTLMTGRPVSFQQNLYDPHYVYRPMLPLNIAGIAQAETFDSGYEIKQSVRKQRSGELKMEAMSASPMLLEETALSPATFGSESQNIADTAGTAQSMAGSTSSSDQFMFTAAEPVSLERQKSIMIPFVFADIPARRFSVFSSTALSSETSLNPKLCIELKNSSGVKLPAGPISVSFGNEYAGDALLDFLPADEKRLIAFGDDLAITGSKQNLSNTVITKVSIHRGLMRIESSRKFITKYTLRNTDSKSRSVMIEQAIRSYAALNKNDYLSEKTDFNYRFVYEVPANKIITPEVEEEQIIAQSIAIVNLSMDSIIQYHSNKEIPPNIQKLFKSIAEEKNKLENLKTNLSTLEKDYKSLESEQNRVRKNLEAVGTESSAGKEFLKKLVSIEASLDSSLKRITDEQKNFKQAEQDYLRYIEGLNF